MKTRRRQEKRCVWCGAWFVPSPRLKGRQKTCGSADCKRRQNLLAQRRWKRRNLEICRQSQRDWQSVRDDGYWKLWRERHPDYVIRNRILTRLRKVLFRRELGLQRKLDILQLFEKQVKFKRFCSLQSKLDRLFIRSSITSSAHERTYERAQGDQEHKSP